MGILLATLFLILNGCSQNKEIPQGFSEQSYTDFTKIYSDYQEAKKDNKESKEYWSILAKYQEKDENGKLTPQESKVNDALGSLLFRYNNHILFKYKRNEFNNQPDIVKYGILKNEQENKIPTLENTIEEILNLPRTVTKENDTKKQVNPAEDVSAENCPKPYTKEDCEQFKDYYTNGEGKFE
ncbi:hypothetical protein COJ40_08815 [Bacillus cereus]|nr:hypothetical protein COJ40_08815 [Bacillus cereus]